MKAAQKSKKKIEHTYLLDGCYRSQFAVHPTDWDKAGASTDCAWYIHYRFYDPRMKNIPPYFGERQIVLRCGNKYPNLQDRRKAVAENLKTEREDIDDRGWNPIRKCFMKEQEPEDVQEYVVHPDTGLINALERSIDLKACEPATKLDLKSVLKYITQAARMAGLTQKPVKDIRKNHIQVLMNQCAIIKGDRWTANNSNHYRKHLSMMFTELEGVGAIEMDPVKSIKKKKVLRETRKVLTPEECQKIDDYLRIHDERFCLLIHVFFHSGARTTEIMRVQGKHVNFQTRTIKYLMKKGKEWKWVERPMKDIAVPFWMKAMEGCGDEDYVFGRGLKPAAIPISPSQITRRWRRHVKDKLGIGSDWYSLKHLNTDQTAAMLGLSAASAMNSHTNANTTKIYAIGEEARQMELLRKVPNAFA